MPFTKSIPGIWEGLTFKSSTFNKKGNFEKLNDIPEIMGLHAAFF